MDGGFWAIMRLRVMPVLVSVAAVLIGIAAVVFIVDTVRDDEGESSTNAARFEFGDFGVDVPDGVFESFASELVLGAGVAEQDGELVVQGVAPGSPAADAGIEEGDVIESVNGEDVANLDELRDALAAIEPGDEYNLTTRRGDDSRTLDLERRELTAESLGDLFEALVTPVRVEGLPSLPRIEVAPALPGGDGGAALGVRTTDTDEGVLVTGVVPGFGAADAGVREGDIITELNDEPVATTAELIELLTDLDPGDVVRLAVLRDGSDEQVSVELSERASNVRGEFRFLTPDGEQRRFQFGPGGLEGFELDGERLRSLLEDLDGQLGDELSDLLEQLLEEGVLPSPQAPSRSGA